jgi:vancomycin resistance protein YoaR
VVPDEPYVSAAAVARAMHRFARPAMSAPVVLVVGGESIIATPAEYSAALAMVPQGHELRPLVDGQRLLHAIRPAMTTVGDKPRDARFRLVRGRPTVVPARIGATFDVEDLARRFPDPLVEPVGRRRMHVKAAVQQPRFTTADATALRVDHVVARATAPLSDRPAAFEAARATAAEVSGRLVRPHRLLVLPAPSGSTTDPAVSQVASTLYTAAFDAGLEVVERTSLPSYRSEFALGVDARVDAGHQLRLRNDTRYGLVPVISVRPARRGRPGSITVRLWSSRAWDVTTRTGRRTRIAPARVVHDDTARCRPTTGTAGFAVTVIRVLRRHGQDSVAARQPFTSHYGPGRTVVCGKAHGRPAHPGAR